MSEQKKSLPIFNPAIPSIIMVIVAGGLGIFFANITKIFNII